VLTTTYLINRFPFKILKGLIPFQLLFGQVLSNEHLKVFGSSCYASTLKVGRDKFQPRATPCVFLGDPFCQKAYKLLNLDTHQVFTSRDVFTSKLFPCHKGFYSNDAADYSISLPSTTDSQSTSPHISPLLLK